MPIQVSEDFLSAIYTAVSKNHKAQLDVDLENQTVTIVDSGEKTDFEINAYKKSCLINGYDDIDFILNQKHLIAEFEQAK